MGTHSIPIVVHYPDWTDVEWKKKTSSKMPNGNGLSMTLDLIISKIFNLKCNLLIKKFRMQ